MLFNKRRPETQCKQIERFCERVRDCSYLVNSGIIYFLMMACRDIQSVYEEGRVVGEALKQHEQAVLEHYTAEV